MVRIGPFFLDLKTTDKLEFTAWIEVNSTFGSRGISIWKFVGQIAPPPPPPPAWLGLSLGCENNLFLFLCSFVQSVIVSWPFFYRTCLMVRCAVLLTIKVSHLKNCWKIFFLDWIFQCGPPRVYLLPIYLYCGHIRLDDWIEYIITWPQLPRQIFNILQCSYS